MAGYPVTRRTVLRSFGAAGLGMASAGFLGSCTPDKSVGPTGVAEGIETLPGDVVIVGLNDLSGMYSDLGGLTARGERIAIDDQPEVAGKQVGYQQLDTEGKPDQAVRRARSALGGDRVFFTGAVLSTVALELSKAINARGGVYTTAAGAPEITGEQCRSGTFRWGASTYGAIQETVVPLLKRRSPPRRWYTITPRSVFGEAMLSATKEALQAYGGEHVGNSYHALDETMFTSYLKEAEDAHPDMLLLLNFGGQAASTLKVASSLGLKEHMEICLASSAGMDHLKGLAPKIVEHVYAGAQYWYTSGTAVNREFLATAETELGYPPGDPMAAGYASTKLLLDGIERAGSARPAEVIAALEGYEYEGLTGTERVRAEDHQVITPYYLLRGRSEAEITGGHDPAKVVSSGKSFRSPSAKRCRLVPLGTA